MSKFVWLITRDHRTTDISTAEYVYAKAQAAGQLLTPVFVTTTEQLDRTSPYHNEHARQFMFESLELLSTQINLTIVNGFDRLKELVPDPEVVGIAHDFSPYARQRVQLLNKLFPGKVVEVSDYTLRDPRQYTRTVKKLKPFISGFGTDPPLPSKFVLLREHTQVLNGSESSGKIESGGERPNQSTSSSLNLKSYYQVNDQLAVRPAQLPSILSNLSETLQGYGNDTIRKRLVSPHVSRLSAFVKFGLISIRQLYYLPLTLAEVDLDAFRREIMFREFFYHLAHRYPTEVFVDSAWSGPLGFISQTDLESYSQNRKIGITDQDRNQLAPNYDKFMSVINSTTPYKLINDAVTELITTGYLPNRQRMILASYMSNDLGLWWKYAENLFAKYLTDYDWTINSLNHQNIAKVGIYPKYTQNFSIETQNRLYLTQSNH